MQDLKRLIREIHRRSLWQVLGIYGVASWAAIQAVETLTSALGLPEWFPPLAVVLLIVGLPIVLATAFLQQGIRPAAPEQPTEERGSEEAVSVGDAAVTRSASGFRALFTWRNAIIGGVLAFALWGVVAAGWMLFSDGRPAGSEPAAGASDRAMLVVLPFENLGSPEDEYFADGITEEVTSRLAVVPGLGVISRTSAVQYKNTDKTAQEIGQELGIDYLLEGTIRWQRSEAGPSRIRVTPQLIRTSDDTHLWADRYDAVLEDIFQVQASIAQKVIEAIDVTLFEGGGRTLDARPTDNVEAYDLYLRGNEYYNRRDFAIAADMYGKAVTLDSTFVLALAKLSIAHIGQYWFGVDRTDERRALAKSAVDRALTLRPELPEAHLALGYYHYWGHLDYASAMLAFERARDLGLKDSDLYHALAAVQRRQAKWDEAARSFATAVELDPRNAHMEHDLGQTLGYMRRFAEAIMHLERAIELAPDVSAPYNDLAFAHIRWKGDTAAARRVLSTAEEKTDSDFRWSRYVIETLERNHAAALARAQGMEDDELRHLAVADVLARTDEAARARAHYDSARVLLETRIAEATAGDASSWTYSQLGLVYAGLGREDEAKEAGERATRLVPLETDALAGASHLWDLAQIYTRVGATEAALDLLEQLLTIPGPASREWLRLDPAWDALRDSPRFRALLGGAA